MEYLALFVLTALSAFPDERSIEGKWVALQAPKGGLLAIVFYSSECPISNELSPLLIETAKSFPANKVRMVGICVDFDASDESLRTHAKEHGLNYPCVVDRSGKLARKFGGAITPEGVVVDDKGKVLYRGRINDIYIARGKRNANPTSRDFHEAIRLSLDGKLAPTPWPKAVGCPIPEFPAE